jgi:hypothetical protein
MALPVLLPTAALQVRPRQVLCVRGPKAEDGAGNTGDAARAGHQVLGAWRASFLR